MEVNSITENRPITVSQLNTHIKNVLKNDPGLKTVYVKGEISTITQSYSGHLYYSLKDENSIINCVIFGYKNFNKKIELKQGMKILVKGRIDVYQPQGKYQLITEHVEEEGKGKLYEEYEQLKKKLNKEGLFKKEHKKEIPKFPEKIGVVTAPTGAVIRDIITTTKRRWPYCEILLFPSLVQGEKAPKEIIKQIKKSETYNIDVLIVGRGGGSIEDLWCFNDENVARTIYNCKTPVISAVGHETDNTIADYVADKRAPTPTAAAELTVPQKENIENHINQLKIRLQENIKSKLNENQQKLDNITEKPIIKDPTKLYKLKKDKYIVTTEKFQLSSEKLIHTKQKQIDEIKNSFLIKNPEKIIDKQKQEIKKYINKLEVLNPLTTLQRGYTLTRYNGKIISNAKNLKENDIVEIEFKDGKIKTKVI